ncbi:MAG: hypothetical protein WC663_03555 [Patescibacteria group bacterium]|jgi:hypothetical protein
MSVEKVNIFGEDENEMGVPKQDEKREQEEREERPQRPEYGPESELEIIPNKEKKNENPFNPGMPKERPVIKKKKEKELPN